MGNALGAEVVIRLLRMERLLRRVVHRGAAALVVAIVRRVRADSRGLSIPRGRAVASTLLLRLHAWQF